MSMLNNKVSLLLLATVTLLFIFSFHSSAKGQKILPTTPMITAEKFQLKSTVLDETRDIYIALPKNYERNIQDYPVVYVLDGEFLFDLTRSITTLRSTRNYMPESIVVGIPNHRHRLEMANQIRSEKGADFYEVGGKTKQYLDFFRHELIPYITKHYRVNGHRTIIGNSPTNGPLYQSFWSQPDLFQGYIGLASNLIYYTESNISQVEAMYNSANDKEHPKASIYLGRAGFDVKKKPAHGEAIKTLNQKFKQINNKNIRYLFEVLEEEEHYGMAIPGIQHGFELIYPKKRWRAKYREFAKEDNPAQAIKDFYTQLSLEYDFTVFPLEDGFWNINNLVGAGRAVKDITKRIAVLKLGLSYYPNSPALYNSLAWAQLDNNQRQEAIAAAMKSVALAKQYKDSRITFFQTDLKKIRL
jgi:predicted alpha/beta superfamily hydrolase